MLNDYLDYLQEGYIVSDKTISVDLDKFESGENNKLLILGNSGSGKTTIGNQLSKEYNVPVLNTDEDFKSDKHFLDTLKNNKRLIIEGIDVITIPEKYYKTLLYNQSMIIMGMSALKAGIKAGIRNKNLGMSSSEILRLTAINFKHIEHRLKKIRKDINNKKEFKIFKI